MTLSEVRRLVRSVSSRVRSLARRSVLMRDSTNARAQANTLADSEDDDFEIFESYGLAAGYPRGSVGVVLRIGGERAQSIGLAYNPRNGRPSDLATGDVALWTDQGVRVLLERNGNVVITPGPGGVVQLGGETAQLAVARETDPTDTPALTQLAAILLAWTPVPTDSGAALKAALTPWLAQYTAPANPAGAGTITRGGQGSTST